MRAVKSNLLLNMYEGQILMNNGYKLGIVVPAFNEAKLISETLEGMPHSADRIYVINDGSTDATGQIIQSFNNDQFYILSNGHNRGVGAAIAAGYKKALEENMDITVVMAGDNQMDAKHLPELLEPLIQGKADYTKGNRLSKFEHCRGMSKWRFFGNWLLTLLTKISSGYWGISDPQNGYTAITRDALRKIDLDDVYPRYGYWIHVNPRGKDKTAQNFLASGCEDTDFLKENGITIIYNQEPCSNPDLVEVREHVYLLKEVKQDD